MSPTQLEPATPLLPQPTTPATSSSSSPSQDADQVFPDFMSCFTPCPAELDVLEAFQQSFGQYGSPKSLLGVAKSRTSIHTSSSSSFSSVPSQPASQPSLPRSRLYSRRTIQPYSAANRRIRIKENPIYTRRQVDDMLSAVSNCFAGTMEQVLKRLDSLAKSDGQIPNQAVRSNSVAGPNNERRKIPSDTLARLFSDLQTFLDERLTTAD
ncbi:hypothetical protein C0991_009345 [Blastosporella zonata]|nr:hypothetical protein C0991_009345 [Blastosporella zonata]